MSARDRAFCQPRDMLFWVYLATLSAALFWRGPVELAGATAWPLLVWALCAVTGVLAVAVLAWALDPHRVLPRALALAALGWGAACGVLVPRSDRELLELLRKLLGTRDGQQGAMWLGSPTAHHILVTLGVFVVLALGRGHVLRPTDGMTVGICCGLGMWAGLLLTAIAHGAGQDPAGQLTGALGSGLPRWLGLVAAQWAPGALLGYGLGAVMTAVGWTRLRRARAALLAIGASTVLACVSEGVLAAGIVGAGSHEIWPWAWAALAGLSFASLLLAPRRSTARRILSGLGALGAVSLLASCSGSGPAPWPQAAAAALTPLVVLGLWRVATRAEGRWLAAALADEEDDVRVNCAQPLSVVDVQARKARTQAALTAWGHKARTLVVALRVGQVRLARGKELLAAERALSGIDHAGAKPDRQWREWLSHLAANVAEERGGIRDVLADMAREDGIYQ